MSRAPVTVATHSPDETRALGRAIGRRAGPGAIIALHGDLGSGKTVFVQGMARGLGVPEECYVTSPTYTLINEYPGRCPLYHVDLYRLAGVGDFEEIGLDDVLYGDGVAAVEWSERLDPDLLGDHLAVHIAAAGGSRREIRMSAHGPGAAILVKDLERSMKEQ
jgi:tRNA threonylcarbamoyladenosine biosynthesis protein TsaE